MVHRVPTTATYRVGDFDLAVISDGHLKLDAGAVFGLIPRLLWEPIVGKDNIDADYRIPLDLNCVVVRRGDDVLLIETGMGTKHADARAFPGDFGHLLERLAGLGLRPEDVTHVANTHLHADHCGWNTSLREGELVPTFPHARYFIEKREWDVALHPNERTRGTYFADNFEPLARTGQLELVEGEREILPGVHFLPTPGHTADHAAIILSSGGETAIYMGDMVHHAVQSERLAWISAFDVLPLMSLESKRHLMARAIRDNALLISAHNAYPGAGRLTEHEGRRTLVPE
jgi:glyoxylase-like metal-dependent hydrolase (beta-lactamase superfamily II)